MLLNSMSFVKKKRLVKFMVILLLTISVIFLTDARQASAENYYLYDQLEFNLNLSGELNLVETDDNAYVKEVKTTVNLYPETNERQELISIQTEGEIINNSAIQFIWNDQIIEEKEFSYFSNIKTVYTRNEISENIDFPIINIESEANYHTEKLELYLQETDIIDWSDSTIIAQANELAEGKDDLFVVTFNLASWVEENVKYNLNSMTAESSKSSSWVLENKEGVCDEMTSLFIAMCRSLGIPARFVTGMTYTESELFEENWQAHGWAEVYFPEHGWVSFDPTFGEYGYIDATHIKLRHSLDPSEPSSLYEWTAQFIDLESSLLNIEVEFSELGDQIDTEFSIETEVLEEESSFGSYNLVKAILKNEKGFYSASTLSLSVPEEIEIVGNKKNTVLLQPKETKEIYWIIRIPENLDSDYRYTYPYTIYTEKNVSVSSYFYSTENSPSYDYNDVKDLAIPEEEDNSYSRKIGLDCDYLEHAIINEPNTVSCQVSNRGNMALEDLEICISDSCALIEELTISQTVPINQEIISEEAGWENILVEVNNKHLTKSEYLNFEVLDESKINFSYKVSDNISYKEDFMINLELTPDSFNKPQNLTILLDQIRQETSWEIEKLTDEQELVIELSSQRLSSENNFEVTIIWEDQIGNNHKIKEEISIIVEGNSLFDKISMLFNKIVNYFYV